MFVIVIRERSGGDGTSFCLSLRRPQPPASGSIRRSRRRVLLNVTVGDAPALVLSFPLGEVLDEETTLKLEARIFACLCAHRVDAAGMPPPSECRFTRDDDQQSPTIDSACKEFALMRIRPEISRPVPRWTVLLRAIAKSAHCEGAAKASLTCSSLVA